MTLIPGLPEHHSPRSPLTFLANLHNIWAVFLFLQPSHTCWLSPLRSRDSWAGWTLLVLGIACILVAPRYLSPPQTSLLGQLICLNISLTLPSRTQTHHTQKRIQSRSPLDLVQLCCHFAHSHSHLRSSQPRQKPSRYLGISFSLRSIICVTCFSSTPQLPPDSYARLPSLSTL